MRADDLLFDRTPHSALYARFEQRGSDRVVTALSQSFCAYDAAALEQSIVELSGLYREQVAGLHGKFTLARPLDNDLAAVDAVTGQGALPGARAEAEP
jgi:hypothetical protein